MEKKNTRWATSGAGGTGRKSAVLQASLPVPHSCLPQLFYLEEQRRLRLQQLATLIQKTYRGWRCRTYYQLMRKSQILISAWFRGNMVPVTPKVPSPSL